MIAVRDIDWYYINLDSRPDRRTHAESEFAKASLSVQRFPALRTQDWTGPEHEISTMKMASKTGPVVNCKALNNTGWCV